MFTILRLIQLTKNPELYEKYQESKYLDNLADKQKSNQKLIEAIQMYKDLIINHEKNLNDTIYREIGERCILRMRFLNKLKGAVEIHKKLIERFPDDPHYQNQLAVTYLLGNQ
jgi:aspartate beta-hydroxylase